jgi:hypothetical protein
MVVSSVDDVFKNVRVADIFGGDQPQLRVVVVYIAVRMLVLTPRIRYSGTEKTICKKNQSASGRPPNE